MRIAQVVASYYPKIGGVEANARRLALGCVQAGDQVTVFTHQLDDSPAEEWIDGVRVLRFPLTVKGKIYQASLALFRSIKENAAEYDLVHAHSYHTLMGHAAARTHLPFVFTPHYHGTGHSSFRAILHQVYRPIGMRQLRAADAIICHSDAEKGLLLKHFPWTCAKLMTIPLGTDLIPVTHPDNTFELTDPTVLVVGRLERYKNVDLVINAFRQLSFPAALVVVGQGPDRERLERHAANCDPERPILFTGTISDELLHQLYARASVVVAASDHEAFGLSVVEGLAFGARVVASAIPSHTEIAESAGVDAPIALVDVRDSQKFTEQIEMLLLAGRPEANFPLRSWDDFVKEVRGLYSRVISVASSVSERPSARETVPRKSS
jgi:glycosyltransferase involved in cell wall biosynthesis